MDLLLSIALKSLLVAAATLLLLKAMHRRSASDRSWIAHLGLAAVLLLPIGAVALPSLEVAGPAFLAAPAIEMAPALPPAATAGPGVPSAVPTPLPQAIETVAAAPLELAFWCYAAPAAALLLLTLIALLRLAALKARANVMVDTHWLTALAHAQRRMGFKNGTALLTSDELASPISWGLMRPVILLNTAATKARGEAEAIIAHELAHVARLDWVKLMLARVTVALFWFNPLVWWLAREAHQLREEAADDAVLQSDIEDTDYANLLVGIARHECRGLLLGAHGVAPGRTSLARRIKRVLDAATARAPGGWRWSSAVAFFAAGAALPVAALQVVNPAIAAAESQSRFVHSGFASTAPATPAVITASAIVTATAGTSAVRTPPKLESLRTIDGRTVMTQPSGATVTIQNGHMTMRAPGGATMTVYPPDPSGRRRSVMHGPNGMVMAAADARDAPGVAVAAATAVASHDRDAIDRAIEFKAVGATREYAEAMRNAAPHLRLGHDNIVQLKAVGVSPAYLRKLARSGYPQLDVDDIVAARAAGVTGAYIRAVAQAGYGSVAMSRLVQLKAAGVTPDYIARFRRANRTLPGVDKIVQLKALGIDPEEIDRDSEP